VAVAFVQLLLLYLLQRRRLLRQKLEAKQMLERVNTELEHKVAKRTRALSETNTRLRKEVAEREQAEQTLRAAQDELVHAAKMAVLGQLATGITHELTQPLGAIRTLSGNAREFLRRGDLEAVGGNLDIVARLVDQMGGIIHPLKSFARKSAAQPAATDVAVAVRNALFLYDQRLRKEGVMLDNRCTAEAALPRVWCDPNRLEQVLINLIGNAVDAMHEPVDGAERHLRIEARLAPSGDALLVQVMDSGPGFDAATAEHLFEPFYTTKPAGAGLGLGLAISRDIVRECGGEIEAHSPADAQLPEAGGARFVIRLPLASSADPSNNPSNPVEDTAP
jgi:two-component system C4-dicarboxylate transport sensor histidine kinase DctB